MAPKSVQCERYYYFFFNFIYVGDYCCMAATDKCEQNLQSVIPTEVAYGAK
jgi:hypothetical protein